MGRPYARVFPDPYLIYERKSLSKVLRREGHTVCATPTMSFPLIAAGSALLCIGVGVENFCPCSAERIRGCKEN